QVPRQRGYRATGDQARGQHAHEGLCRVGKDVGATRNAPGTGGRASSADREALMTAPNSSKSNSRVFAAFAAALFGLVVSSCGYNTIPTYEEQAKAKWSDVQNNYQRRADLIPNLVATVQGYAKQEKDVLTAVVEARAKATQVKIDVSQLSDPEKLKQFQDA